MVTVNGAITYGGLSVVPGIYHLLEQIEFTAVVPDSAANVKPGTQSSR